MMHGHNVGQDGQRRDDLELKLENPLGFFESKHLVDINDGLLRLLGSKWDRPPLLPASWDQPPCSMHFRRSAAGRSYALDHDWVDKDPRLRHLSGLLAYPFVPYSPCSSNFENPLRWLHRCMLAMVSARPRPGVVVDL